MVQQPTPKLRAEAVRVALTSGLPRKQVAPEFGVGSLTLSRRIQKDRRNPEKPSARIGLALVGRNEGASRRVTAYTALESRLAIRAMRQYDLQKRNDTSSRPQHRLGIELRPREPERLMAPQFGTL